MKLISEKIDDVVTPSPTLGSFYILDGIIYYNLIDYGLKHPAFWKEIVCRSGLFDRLILNNRIDLINAPYCTDRGRVTWVGKSIGDTPDFTSEGYFRMMGTSGCEKYEKNLKTLFGIDLLTEDQLNIDWKTDRHYRVRKEDTAVLKDMLHLIGQLPKSSEKIVKLITFLKRKVSFDNSKLVYFL